MSPKPRRNFTAQQKAEAVKIVRESGKSANQVAREMGLTASALRNWVKQAEIDQHPHPQGPLTSSERKEVNELRRELKRVQMERDFLKKGSSLLCQGKLRPYELIDAQKAQFPIALMCKVLNVSRSGYYAWCQRPPAPRTQENEMLSQEIQQIHKDSRDTYGSPRIHAALIAKGWQVSRQRVVRLMEKLGICAHPQRKFKVTTDSGHDLPIAANTLDRNFSTAEPDQAWVADISVPQQRRERWEKASRNRLTGADCKPP